MNALFITRVLFKNMDGCIILIKSDSKKKYDVTKYLYLKKYPPPKNVFHKNIKQNKIDNIKKCFLSIKSVY